VAVDIHRSALRRPGRGRTVVAAHATVTFTAPKIGQLISQGAARCGRLVVRASVRRPFWSKSWARAPFAGPGPMSSRTSH